MKRIFYCFFILLFTVYCLSGEARSRFAGLFPLFVYADEYDDLQKKIDDLNKALEMSRAATTPLEETLKKLETDIANIREQIKKLENDLRKKEKEVADGEKLLTYQQEILERKVRSLYKNMSQTSSVNLQVLFGKSLSEVVRSLGYQKSVVADDKNTIAEVVLYIKDLEEKKKQIENEKVRLAKAKEDIDAQAEFFRKEIAGAKKYQIELGKQIAQLSARQKELIAQKLQGLNLPSTLGAGPLYCTDDRKIDPGFSPAFAFFTFGIPHRVGLNQYGALGRAQNNQNYQDILRAYFANINFEKRDPNTRIKVQGYGEKGLEEYLLGVYEMYDNWPMEALKAQVVAARSFALAYTNNGANEICTTQACQVYKGGNKGGNWETAVRATEGEVMVTNGEVIKAWYATTFGGYSFTSGDVWRSNRPWTKRTRDTNGDINSFNDLFAKAYDKDSPCFYAAQGWRNEYNKSAWLKSEEVADIVNVLLLAKRDSSTQKHLSQIDKPNPDGEETWDFGRIKSELKSRGGTPFNNISNVSIDWDKNQGITTTVSLTGDAGEVSFSGEEFINFFNLRAPANIQIVGALFNIEKK